jgi:outer membrane protein, heavy metal efflux system
MNICRFLILTVLFLTRFAVQRCSAVAVTNEPIQITATFINQLAEEARTNNPSLGAADARSRAALENHKSVRIWEDPMLRFGFMGAERAMRMDDGDLIYGAEQKLPLFGKPQAERRVAKAEAQVIEATALNKFQQVRRDIAQTIFRIALADRAVEIAREDLTWVDLILGSVERRYESGLNGQFDVLRLQNEGAQRTNQISNALQSLSREHANLNRLLNRDLQSRWPVLRLPQVAKKIAFSERLIQLATKGSSELKMRREEITAAKAMVAVAQRKRYPDFNLGAELRNYSGDGEFRQSMVALSFNLPWGNRKSYGAEIKREEARLHASHLDVEDAELALKNEIYALTIKIESARREALLYRDEMIPRGVLALESAQTGWENGSAQFRDVLDAQRMWVDSHLMFARAVSEQYQMMSELVLCCGLGDLEALEMIGAPLEPTPSEAKP